MTKRAALEKKFDLFICQLDYGKGEWQVCDGSGRDGFVLATAPTLEKAIDKAYKKYFNKG